MPERILEHISILLYALAAISGGLGGCAVASHGILRGQKPRLSYILAYGILGMVFGVLAMAYGAMFGLDTSMDKLIGNSVLAGSIGSFTLAATNISARVLLKRLGIEIQVTVKRKGESDQ